MQAKRNIFVLLFLSLLLIFIVPSTFIVQAQTRTASTAQASKKKVAKAHKHVYATKKLTLSSKNGAGETWSLYQKCSCGATRYVNSTKKHSYKTTTCTRNDNNCAFGEELTTKVTSF